MKPFWGAGVIRSLEPFGSGKFADIEYDDGECRSIILGKARVAEPWQLLDLPVLRKVIPPENIGFPVSSRDREII